MRAHTRNDVPVQEHVREPGATGPNTLVHVRQAGNLPSHLVRDVVVTQPTGDILTNMEPGKPEDSTAPVVRSVALVIRSSPWVLIYTMLTVGFVWAFAVPWYVGMIFMGLLTAGTYTMMNWQEYGNSFNALELKRMQMLAELKAKEMDQAHELRKTVLDIYINNVQNGVPEPRDASRMERWEQ